MKEIPTTTPYQRASCSGLQLINQVVPHTGSWHPLATKVDYLIRIAPIVYMAFQAWPASPVGVLSDSGMGCDTNIKLVGNLSRSAAPL
ncbi:hypothetical protein DSO57_1039060 [Entomophthora muscae]|uniref:Uncharacterized protein n=1 Tax=Entomophthora muscae TaxID=34485 RepID=A0ACC2T976_9FUNG|nr:hypothetical protein DSO57_1039060 [Entomophthora muscae]